MYNYADYRHPHLPSIVNPNSFWTPFMVDSINQMGVEDQIMDQWQLYSNGTVVHQYHLNIEYRAVMPLDAFPFDKHYFIATRRTRSQMVDRVKINVAKAGFSIPPKNPMWTIGEPGAIVCPRHEISGYDASDCRPLCTPATCPGWVPGSPQMYVPPAGGCAPNPGCNATYPFPNCHATCGETAALCQDVFVFYYKVSRKPQYHMQNMLAPIILITIMAASAYWNSLDAYADRVGLMATALLSMMALQAYVSGELPQTQTVTYIHYALYTSYALMGFGMAFIIAASFCLRHDIDAAKGDAPEVKIWMLRRYYSQRIGGGGAAAELGDVVAHKAVADADEAVGAQAAQEGAQRAARLQQQAAASPEQPDVLATAPTGRPPRTLFGRCIGRHVVASALKPRGDVGAAVDNLVLASAEEQSPVTWPYLGRFIVELDYFMRLGHLLIFAVVIGARYFVILAMGEETPTCANLLDFINSPLEK